MKYYAKIEYTIDNGHPDIECINDWTENKVFTYEDTYTFNDDYYDDHTENIAYIKRDLSLVAGGGYNTKHIHNVVFDIKKV